MSSDADRRFKYEVEKPAGYVYYASCLTVSGTNHHQKECSRFLKLPGRNHFHLVREPSNRYDRNAIAFYCGSLHLGYVDRETAAEIAQDGRFDDLIVYPKGLYVTQNGYLMIDYALLKPGARFKPEQRVAFLEFDNGGGEFIGGVSTIFNRAVSLLVLAIAVILILLAIFVMFIVNKVNF